MAFDLPQAVEVDFPAQWESLVPTGVDYLPGSPNIVDQFRVCLWLLRHYE
jgi:hypothetical protein